MIFTFDITVPAGTSDSTPKKQNLVLAVGVIESIETKFPAGCNGLVKIRITRSGSPIAPLSANEYITGDNESVLSDVEFKLESGNTVITFEGSSPSATYDHTITLRINVQPVTQSGAATTEAVTALGGTLGQKLDYIIYLLSREWNGAAPPFPVGMAEPSPLPTPQPEPTPEPQPVDEPIPISFTGMPILENTPPNYYPSINTDPVELLWIRWAIGGGAGNNIQDEYKVVKFALERDLLTSLTRAQLFTLYQMNSNTYTLKLIDTSTFCSNTEAILAIYNINAGSNTIRLPEVCRIR